MIPKKIHYCWFGKSEMPSREKRCVESWKKFMPDFELVLWNEDNFDVNSTIFTKQAYELKKFAFVSDYVRLFALQQEGGIYLDTDVEIVKPFSEFLKYNAFGSFETPNVIQTGVLASVPNGELINKIFKLYENKEFVLENGTLNQIPNTKILTDLLLQEGLVLNNKRQSLPLIEIFPTEYFCPINQATQEIIVTDNTYCIHYLSGSWLSKKDRFTRKLKTIFGYLFGYKFVGRIRELLVKEKNL